MNAFLGLKWYTCLICLFHLKKKKHLKMLQVVGGEMGLRTGHCCIKFKNLFLTPPSQNDWVTRDCTWKCFEKKEVLNFWISDGWIWITLVYWAKFYASPVIVWTWSVFRWKPRYTYLINSSLIIMIIITIIKV